MTAPARTAAFHALRAIATGRTDLPTALADSRAHLPDDRDRSLAAVIVTGTERWRRCLDHLIAHFSARPLTKIDAEVLHILRLSLYQILHLDRVPAAAVVDDAVELVRQARKASATGFVNAVLRTAARQRHGLPLPPRPDAGADREAALAYLGITHSHPDWLVARWLDRYGFDATERWVRFNNDTPSMTLRANTLRTTRDAVAEWLHTAGVETAATRYAPDGLVVTSGNPLRATGGSGRFFVQDEASQLVSLTVGARPGDRTLDLCASPGGKTVAMAADMRDTGLLVACDVRARRVALLRDTVRASGASCVRVVQVDVSETGWLPFRQTFDSVLVDAPCSGLGTIRRDPDIRWRLHEPDLRGFAMKQGTLLARAAGLLRPGGRLVYATCSSEPEENDEVVSAFLDRHPEFEAIDLRDDASPPLASLLDERGTLRTLPFAHGLEAFFAAAMRRRPGA